jgi:hypothetical protein
MPSNGSSHMSLSICWLDEDFSGDKTRSRYAEGRAERVLNCWCDADPYDLVITRAHHAIDVVSNSSRTTCQRPTGLHRLTPREEKFYMHRSSPLQLRQSLHAPQSSQGTGIPKATGNLYAYIHIYIYYIYIYICICVHDSMAIEVVPQNGCRERGT